jgi:beta-glucosidase
VHLEPNEKKNVTITCSLDKCRWYNPDTNQWELEHMEYETYIGTSSSNRDLIMGTFSV